ncbi:MAG: hypothetical protein ACKOFQ_02705 [Candidatus Nanopelagicus sp.]|jgi:hypothetical protein|nr:hypothetical protein [Actinomycetota bacterium]
MNPLNNYRFGSYAILAIGLINLRYQTGSDQNLAKSLVLILSGALVLILTFMPMMREFLIRKLTQKLALILLLLLIAYSLLV